jgi:hypothetical protein
MKEQKKQITRGKPILVSTTKNNLTTIQGKVDLIKFNF